MDDLLVLTENEKGVLKVGVTVAYADEYGLSYGSAAEYFYRNQIYPYLDLHSGLLVTKTYPFLAQLVADEFGVPGKQIGNR